MARSLADIVRRRMPLTLLSRPDTAVLERVADCVAPVAGWSPGQVRAEVDEAMRQWPVVRSPDGV